MTETASKQLRRILQIIPAIADENEHDLAEVARLGRVCRAMFCCPI